jgi:hypothetical protein
MVALPAGSPSIVSVGEVPGVMSKSCVLAPAWVAVGVTAISKHNASAGILTKAMAMAEVRSADSLAGPGDCSHDVSTAKHRADATTSG